MKKYIINGKFMSDRMQGIVRYSREILKSLDEILDDSVEVELALPGNALNVPSLKKIKVQFIGNNKGIKWEQTDLRKYLKKHDDSICINLCNVTPFFIQPGITTIHDIMYKVNPSHYSSFRNRISRLWHIVQYKYITEHERVVLTDSIFSKTEIEKYYPKSKGKIMIVPCAWQHINQYQESENWEKKFPFLKSKKFYFSLATLSKNKNGAWLVDAAQYNPSDKFAIAGKYYETDLINLPSNVHLLGFVSDEDACSLMKNCKAFIFPSSYEGFGLPPLEALALGARVISSDSSSLPEVLGDAVYYVSAKNGKVKLDDLIASSVGDRNKTLNRFSWEKSAQKLLDIMKSF